MGRTQVSGIAGRFSTVWATRQALLKGYFKEINKDGLQSLEAIPNQSPEYRNLLLIWQTGPMLGYAYQFMTTLHKSPHSKGSELKHLGNIFYWSKEVPFTKSKIMSPLQDVTARVWICNLKSNTDRHRFIYMFIKYLLEGDNSKQLKNSCCKESRGWKIRMDERSVIFPLFISLLGIFWRWGQGQAILNVKNRRKGSQASFSRDENILP